MEVFKKLTKGDQVRFRDNTVLWFSHNFNGKQGFFQNEFGTGNYRKDYLNIISINGKPLQENKMKLQEILKQEINNIIKEQQEEVLTFEKDPIEYIIQKYPSLDATLIDLMTESYKDYLTGIYVMAPKPTTFKILLHNGQSFYLIYNPKAYIAKVSGKKYHLISLKDEEYAIKSIAQLLMMGIPPSAQGPDTEQTNETDSKSDFAADMTSEPDLTAGLDDLETPGEEPEGEAAPEGEEELQEQEESKKKVRFRIIKEIKINNPRIPYTLEQLKDIYDLADSNNPNEEERIKMENILQKIGFIDSEGVIKTNLKDQILIELDKWAKDERT